MKKILFTLAAALLFTAGFGQSAQGDDAQPKTMALPDSATMAKNWMTAMTPGEKHKMMAKWAGEWKGEVTTWMVPGAPPEKSTVTAVNKVEMNGLYMTSEHKGNFGGMPFYGKGTMGFDNLRGVFVSTWIDNMGSSIMYMEGPLDETGKTIILSGRVLDAGSAAMVNMRQVHHLTDDTHQVMEMYQAQPGGKEAKIMEIKFTKTK